jgi:hypothetical protein
VAAVVVDAALIMQVKQVLQVEMEILQQHHRLKEITEAAQRSLDLAQCMVLVEVVEQVLWVVRVHLHLVELVALVYPQ